jgi:hypothetical protein
MKKTARRLPPKFTEQSGQALILVLIFLLLGSLTLVPALANIGTALKTGVRYEKKTDALYAADSGIEDGMWQIKYDGLQTMFGGGESYEYDFTNNASYVLDSPVNGLTTNVSVQNIWIPSNVTLADLGLSADDAKTIIDSEKLVVSGTSGAVPGQPYHIMIQFVPATGDNLTIKSVGVWLPQGFHFISGNSSLELTGHTYTTVPTVSPHSGGEAVVWSYTAPYPLFTAFPNLVSENGTLTSTISFSYTPPTSDPSRMPSAVAWVTAEMADSNGNPKVNPNSPENVPIAWDVDTRIYKISSKAGDTRVEAYSSKRELRDMNDAMSGDYVAIGNSLMIGNVERRDVLLSSSATTVSSVPADADVISAYLYWSGFKHYTTVFSDTCTNFDNWTRTTEERVPAADGDITGTWDTSPCWDDVDETTAKTPSDGPRRRPDCSPFLSRSFGALFNLTVYVRAKGFVAPPITFEPLSCNGISYDTFGGITRGSFTPQLLPPTQYRGRLND